jgi:hypothetical protein
MHKEILTENQLLLLPLVKEFSRNFGLVGGTAIALQIGHRRSIDFDLFSMEKFDNIKIRKKINQKKYNIKRVFKDEDGQYTFHINDVQFTFFHYPYPVKFDQKLGNYLMMPDLLTLGAMKAFALGRRAKWKDYVDLYFILEKFHSIKQINKKSSEIFGSEYNERIIREQLAYFDDINYSEEVVFMEGFETSEKKIKQSLTEYSLS